MGDTVRLGDSVIYTDVDSGPCAAIVVSADALGEAVNLVYWTKEGQDKVARRIKEGVGNGTWQRRGVGK